MIQKDPCLLESQCKTNLIYKDLIQVVGLNKK